VSTRKRSDHQWSLRNLRIQREERNIFGVHNKALGRCKTTEHVILVRNPKKKNASQASAEKVIGQQRFSSVRMNCLLLQLGLHSSVGIDKTNSIRRDIRNLSLMPANGRSWNYLRSTHIVFEAVDSTIIRIFNNSISLRIK
jgi:hypothetical protein